MAWNLQPLFEPLQLPAAAAALYTSTGLKTNISQFVLKNPSTTTSYTYSLYWVPNGGAIGAANALRFQETIFAQASVFVDELIDQTLGVGDAIWGVCSVANVVNVFASGLAIS